MTASLILNSIGMFMIALVLLWLSISWFIAKTVLQNLDLIVFDCLPLDGSTIAYDALAKKVEDAIDRNIASKDLAIAFDHLAREGAIQIVCSEWHGEEEYFRRARNSATWRQEYVAMWKMLGYPFLREL